MSRGRDAERRSNPWTRRPGSGFLDHDHFLRFARSFLTVVDCGTLVVTTVRRGRAADRRLIDLDGSIAWAMATVDRSPLLADDHDPRSPRRSPLGRVRPVRFPGFHAGDDIDMFLSAGGRRADDRWVSANAVREAVL